MKSRANRILSAIFLTAGIGLLAISVLVTFFSKKSKKKYRNFPEFINSFSNKRALQRELNKLEKRGDSGAQLLAAHALLLTGQCRRAEELYKKLYSRREFGRAERAKILNNLALARLCQGDKKGAKKLLTKSLSTDLSYKRAKFNLELMMREKKPPPPNAPPPPRPPPPPKGDPPLKLPPPSKIDLSKFDRFYPYGFLKRSGK